MRIFRKILDRKSVSSGLWAGRRLACSLGIWIQRAWWNRNSFWRAWQDDLAEERPHWILWAPIALGMGISLYLLLPQEPTWFQYGLGVLGVAASFLLWRVYRGRRGFTLIGTFSCWACFWGVLGFGLMFYRAESLNPGMLSLPITGRIEGTIASIEHMASSRRLFQRVIVNDLRAIPERRTGTHSLLSSPSLPDAVRLTFRTSCVPLYKGDRVRVVVRLMPFPTPILPNGYDAGRQNFFAGVGAYGFSLSPVEVLESHPSWLDTLRQTLTRTFHETLGPPLGAMACALITGDKAALPKMVREDFANSGLSHVLAISGLHLSLITGFCFFVLQRVLSWIPYVALYGNLQCIAALSSLGMGWLYFQISGQGYPVQRSFWMLAAAMMASLLQRRIYPLRILALCALGILIPTPEALQSLSFQLSFAAVAALLALYRNSSFERGRRLTLETGMERNFSEVHYTGWYGIGKSVWTTLMTTGVVTLVTLPIMAFYFHKVSLQCFLSNALAIPLTGFLIMPLGLLTLLVWAMGLDASLWFQGWGWSLYALERIAHFTAVYLDGLIFWVPPFGILGFGCMLLGTFWCLLWSRPWRWLGLIPWGVGFGLAWLQSQRPMILVDPEKKLVAYADYGERTLWLSSKRRGKFQGRQWASAFGLQHLRYFALEDNTAVFTLPCGERLAMVEDGSCVRTLCERIFSWKAFRGSIPHVILGDFPKGGVTLVYRRHGTVKIVGPKGSKRPWAPLLPVTEERKRECQENGR